MNRTVNLSVFWHNFRLARELVRQGHMMTDIRRAWMLGPFGLLNDVAFAAIEASKVVR